MAGDDWLARVAGVRRYQRHGRRAPHKPLVLLAALARFQQTGSSALAWTDHEAALEDLVRDFGPPNRSTAAHPFRRLANDEGLWRLTTAAGDGAMPDDSPAALRRAAAIGSLDPALEADLHRRPELLPTLARFLLDDNFEPTFHDDLCRQVGLDVEGAELALVRGRVVALRAPRDPNFRTQVLRAYERRCAACGFDGTFGGDTVGLDAAHVRWWSHDGPDEVDNGLCLCSLHHTLFDRGVLGIADEGTIDVAQDFVARSETGRRMVVELAGRPLLGPQRGHPPPATDHVGWHRREVFREPARVGS